VVPRGFVLILHQSKALASLFSFILGSTTRSNGFAALAEAKSLTVLISGRNCVDFGGVGVD
jgi:hypothetical protein